MKIQSGHVAVITGAASGIGYGLAEALVSRGVRVILSDIRAEAVEASAAKLRENGGEVTAVVADVSDEASVQALADRTMSLYGRVDLVCNNAGLVSPEAPMWEQDGATWQRMVGVKVFGVINGVKVFAPLLIANGGGHFLNTASSGGLAPLPGRSPYTATMHAVVGLTETLDLELKAVSPDLGATVLCPGLVDTPLGQNSADLGAIELPPGAPTSIRELVPDPSMVLSPAQVAESALAAVEAGRLHVAPGADVPARATARVEELLADIALS